MTIPSILYVHEGGSLSDAVTTMGALTGTVIVDGRITLSASVTIPATLALEIRMGGSITKASTYTLTINGPFSAPRVAVFKGFSSGNVLFGTASVADSYAEWWDTDTAAQAAAAAASTTSATSGTNTGDETTATIKTKLGITTLSGSNTGDQTNITGNAVTATALATPRAIGGTNFDGSADIEVVRAKKTETVTITSGAVALTTCYSGILTNYNQSADVAYTLPAAAAGLSFKFFAGTTVAKYVRFTPNASEVIYLDGVAATGGYYIGIASIAAGNSVEFTTFKTGTSAWAWHAHTLSGTWVVQSS